MQPPVIVEQERAVLRVTLNRPHVHNALSPALIAALTQVFTAVAQQETVRVVLLTGAGRSFCAGADLSAMRAAADFSFEENVADSRRIHALMQAIDHCPKPVIGRINGAAIGGGAGLVCCCDIAVAVNRARFAFSETRLGVVPAVIAPFVLARIGSGHARELFLTGERFDAARAERAGLVHYVVAEEDLEACVAERVEQLLQAAPGAQAAAKELLRTVAQQAPGAVSHYTAQLLAQRRESAEGREGMSAFLEKRPPAWLDAGHEEDG